MKLVATWQLVARPASGEESRGREGSHFLDSSSLSLLFLKTSELINISLLLVWQVSLSQLSGVFGQLFSWPVSGH